MVCSRVCSYVLIIGNTLLSMFKLRVTKCASNWKAGLDQLMTSPYVIMISGMILDNLIIIILMWPWTLQTIARNQYLKIFFNI